MFEHHTPLQVAGQLLLALAFLGTGIRNAFWKFGQHADRMTAYGVPFSKIVLTIGFVLQFSGSLSLVLDYQRQIGAALLIAFTVLASLIFHRWWLIQDPLLRHLHISFLFINAGLIGALLMVMAI